MINVASFDGGGVNGLKSLYIAAAIEKQTGKKFLELFDVIVGTSTGGIISAMMIRGYSASEIIEIYEKECGKIFAKPFWRTGLFGTKFSEKNLEKMLDKYISDYRLNDLDVNTKTRLIITANRQDQIEPIFFDSKNDQNNHVMLKDVVRATTAAPFYFRPHKIEGGLYSDGGTFMNNPALWGYLEAMDEYGYSEVYNVISIGTSRQEEPVLWKGGLVGWVAKLFPVMLRSRVKLMNNITDKLCNGLSDKYWRIEPLTDSSSGKMDDASPNNIKNVAIDGQLSVVEYMNEINDICKQITVNK